MLDALLLVAFGCGIGALIVILGLMFMVSRALGKMP